MTAGRAQPPYKSVLKGAIARLAGATAPHPAPAPRPSPDGRRGSRASRHRRSGTAWQGHGPLAGAHGPGSRAARGVPRPPHAGAADAPPSSYRQSRRRRGGIAPLHAGAADAPPSLPGTPRNAWRTASCMQERPTPRLPRPAPHGTNRLRRLELVPACRCRAARRSAAGRQRRRRSALDQSVSRARIQAPMSLVPPRRAPALSSRTAPRPVVRPQVPRRTVGCSCPARKSILCESSDAKCLCAHVQARPPGSSPPRLAVPGQRRSATAGPRRRGGASAGFCQAPDDQVPFPAAGARIMPAGAGVPAAKA